MIDTKQKNNCIICFQPLKLGTLCTTCGNNYCSTCIKSYKCVADILPCGHYTLQQITGIDENSCGNPQCDNLSSSYIEEDRFCSKTCLCLNRFIRAKTKDELQQQLTKTFKVLMRDRTNPKKIENKEKEFRFYWDVSRTHSGILLSDNNTRIRTLFSAGEFISAIGSNPIPSKGNYIWKITFNKFECLYPKVGIVELTDKDLGELTDSKINNISKRTDGHIIGISTKGGRQLIANKDVVFISVDLNAKKLLWSIENKQENNERQLKVEENKKYYPFITFNKYMDCTLSF